MAGVAVRGKSNELAAGRALVAGLAGQRGVCADQRKTVLVLLYVLDGNLPALHRMAGLALSSHLSAMNIGMAISAFLSHVSEYKFYVTLRARDLGVHPAQRVGSLVVVEIRNGADRLPVDAGVARLAGQVERAVGATRGGAILRSLLPGKGERRHHNQEPHEKAFHLASLRLTKLVTAKPVKWVYSRTWKWPYLFGERWGDHSKATIAARNKLALHRDSSRFEFRRSAKKCDVLVTWPIGRRGTPNSL